MTKPLITRQTFVEHTDYPKLNKWKRRLMHQLENKFGNKIAFGGSFVLNVLGIIDRPINDIDIVVNENHVDLVKDWLKNEFMFVDDLEEYGSMQMDDKELTHYILRKQNLKVCIFGNNVNVTEFECIRYEWDNISLVFRICPLKPIIKAKEKYVNRLTHLVDLTRKQQDILLKHKSDLVKYHIWEHQKENT